MTPKVIQSSYEITDYYTLILFFIQWVQKRLNCQRIRDKYLSDTTINIFKNKYQKHCYIVKVSHRFVLPDHKACTLRLRSLSQYVKASKE